MKPLNLIALLLFLGGAVWAFTQSERAVREMQDLYFSAMSPFLKSGSKMETRARDFLQETRHSKELEVELGAIRTEVGRLRIIESRYRELELENERLRHALDYKKSTHFDVVPAQVIRRQPTTWWQTVDIDAGEEHGVITRRARIGVLTFAPACLYKPGQVRGSGARGQVHHFIFRRHLLAGGLGMNVNNRRLHHSAKRIDWSS